MFCLILAVGLFSCVRSWNVCFELPITLTTDLFELLIDCLCVAFHSRMHSTCQWGPWNCLFESKIEMKTKISNFHVVVSRQKLIPFEEFLDFIYFRGKYIEL